MENKTSLNTFFSKPLAVLGMVGLIILTFLIIGTVTQSDETNFATSFLVSDSFPMLALLAFVGGLFSFLSPCTLPILPAYFTFAFRGGRTTIAANTFAFMLGLATMFSVLGAGASTIGRVLFQSQSRILLLGGAVVIVMGMMSLLGQGFTGATKITEQEHSRTMTGSFLFGITFAAGWSSCIGPILGIMLSLAATTGSVINGAMLLFIYTMGLGLPLLLVSVFMGKLPKSHFVWRALRGRGWSLNAPNWLPSVLYGYGAWLIALPFIREFTSWNIDEPALLTWDLNLGRLHMPFSFSAVELGLLAALIGAAVLIAIVRHQGIKNIPLNLHSTQLITGIIFLLMGILLINNQLAIFASLETSGLAEQILCLEDKLLTRFMGGSTETQQCFCNITNLDGFIDNGFFGRLRSLVCRIFYN